MPRVKGVILDVDGTLVDSNDAHARSWVEALAEFAIHVPFERVRRLIGMGTDKLLPTVCGVTGDSPRGQEMSKRRGEIFKERYLPTLRPFAQADQLLRRMRDAGLRLAVASSATEDDLEALLRICGADGLVEKRTSSDDTDHSKPDPDIIHAALNRLRMSPPEAMMLGDTPYDIAAAARAGIGTVAVRCGGWADADLNAALAIYDDPADLLAHFDRSPFVAPAT
jgi:HAD superfamily hydrolase (TIGR01509 family)